jgi:hypothetical protein
VLDILALKMLLQLAMQDIGQLTDIEPRLRSRATPPALIAQFPGGRRFRADRSVCIDRASGSLAFAWASLG